MSDYIPFEILTEIMNRLPVKSLIQIRSVSKSWKSLIDSSEFIAGYGVYNTQPQPQRLLVKYEDHHPRAHTQQKYVLVADDNTFAKQDIAPIAHVLKLKPSSVFGNSHGLLCFYGFNSRTPMVALCNPSIRKSIGIVVPDMLGLPFDFAMGFGVCPITSDPTIIKITYGNSWNMNNNASHPWKVQIFKLSLGTWSNLSCKIPRKTIRVSWCQVAIDRFIYWLASDYRLHKSDLIMSFDITTQELGVIDLPPSFSHRSFVHIDLNISTVRDSLAVLEYTIINDMFADACDVWIMEDGDTKLFIKLFTIHTPYLSFKILGFRKNDDVIMEIQDDYQFKEPVVLKVYEPSSEHFTDLRIYGKVYSFFVSSYMETLLLLDQPDYKFYN